MLLKNIKEVLQEKGPSTVATLSKYIEYDESTIQRGVSLWIEKGSVKEVIEPNKCAQCRSHCFSVSYTEPAPRYKWVI